MSLLFLTPLEFNSFVFSGPDLCKSCFFGLRALEPDERWTSVSENQALATPLKVETRAVTHLFPCM